MTITFTRTGERSYRTVVERGGVIIQVPSYDRPVLLPHDLAHCVVERALGLRRGFWGRVAAGALFPGMVVVQGKRPPRAAERSRQVLKEMQAGQYGTEAEVLVGVLEEIEQTGMENDWPAARRMLSRAWRPTHPSRELPNHAEVKSICTALREARRQWRALPIGECITVEWPQAETRSSPPASLDGHHSGKHGTSGNRNSLSRTGRRHVGTGRR